MKYGETTPSSSRDLILMSVIWNILQNLRQSLSPELFLVSLVVCWKVWDVRNGEVHGGERGFPPDLVAWGSDFLNIYKLAQQRESVIKSPELPTIWQPPGRDAIKINVDVGLPSQSNSFFVGMVARDSSGACIWWCRKDISSRPPPSDGEAIAIFHGIKAAVSRIWSRVIIETDCLPVYRYLIDSHSSLVSLVPF